MDQIKLNSVTVDSISNPNKFTAEAGCITSASMLNCESNVQYMEKMKFKRRRDYGKDVSNTGIR